MTTNKPLYPLIFNPIYKEKIWGGRQFTKFNKLLPSPKSTLIGESWELADLSHTSVSGGGGGVERSVVANGSLAGLTLKQLIETYGETLIGRLQLTAEGEFPLLVKFLDARENLSLQVHPSEAYATNHPNTFLKSEAWYIVDAKPGAVIYKGIKQDTSPQAFRQALEANDVPALMEMLIKVPAKKGDCHYLPSGTCHALGGGILVAEVQTPSDTTFRVFDWGRTERELHIKQAMSCITFSPPQVKEAEKRQHVAGMFTTVSRLIRCDYFQIERIRMSEGYEQEIPYDQLAIWILLQGQGVITPGNGAEKVHFKQGQTLLIPAHMDDARVQLEQDTVWLEVTFPQVELGLFA